MRQISNDNFFLYIFRKSKCYHFASVELPVFHFDYDIYLKFTLHVCVCNMYAMPLTACCLFDDWPTHLTFPFASWKAVTGQVATYRYNRSACHRRASTLRTTPVPDSRPTKWHARSRPPAAQVRRSTGATATGGRTTVVTNVGVHVVS